MAVWIYSQAKKTPLWIMLHEPHSSQSGVYKRESDHAALLLKPVKLAVMQIQIKF